MTGADLLALIKKQPIAFAAGFVALVCAVLMYFNMGEVDAAAQRYEEKQTEARKVNDNLRFAQGLAEQTAELKQAGAEFETRLVRASQLASNLQFFYRLESETGVKLLDVRQNPIPVPRTGAPKTQYSPVPFTLSVQGTYPQIFDFVRRVEAGSYFTRFTNVTVTKAASDQGFSDRLNVSLALEMLGQP